MFPVDEDSSSVGGFTINKTFMGEKEQFVLSSMIGKQNHGHKYMKYAVITNCAITMGQ